MYSGQKVQAVGSPRETAPSGCEAPREAARANQTAVVVQAYADMIRVKWDGETTAEDGWRRRDDFSLTTG